VKQLASPGVVEGAASARLTDLQWRWLLLVIFWGLRVARRTWIPHRQMYGTGSGPCRRECAVLVRNVDGVCDGTSDAGPLAEPPGPWLRSPQRQIFRHWGADRLGPDAVGDRPDFGPLRLATQPCPVRYWNRLRRAAVDLRGPGVDRPGGNPGRAGAARAIHFFRPGDHQLRGR